jgi:hypothetical protein
MARAAWGGPVLEHHPGSTEPWISRLVADFVIATGARSVLETGGYLGATSIMLADALIELGGGSLTACEIDSERATAIHDRLTDRRISRNAKAFQYVVYAGDVRQFLRTTTALFEVAFVDDCHEEKHVRDELALLLPKMRPGGLVLMHDVVGLCPGNREPLGCVCEEFGGTVLDLPRMGPAGGLGLIQCA